MLPLSSSDVLELLGCSIRMAVRRHQVIDCSITRKVLNGKDDSATVQSVYVLCKGNIVLFLYTLPSVKRNIHIFTAFFLFTASAHHDSYGITICAAFSGKGKGGAATSSQNSPSASLSGLVLLAGEAV